MDELIENIKSLDFAGMSYSVYKLDFNSRAGCEVSLRDLDMFEIGLMCGLILPNKEISFHYIDSSIYFIVVDVEVPPQETLVALEYRHGLTINLVPDFDPIPLRSIPVEFSGEPMHDGDDNNLGLEARG